MGKIKQFGVVGAGAGMPFFAAVLSLMLMFAGSALGFTITFNAGGGTVSPATGATRAADSTLASLPKPTKTNSIFHGWFTTATGGAEVTTSTKFASDSTIYAQWVYKVTFNPGTGATVAPTVDTTGVNGKLDSLPTPTRPGYKFDGWFTALTGGTEVTLEKVYTENAAIQAMWSLITYTITLDAAGGAVSKDTVVTGSGGKITSSLPTPTRAGYTFDNWYTAETEGDKITTGSGSSATVFTEDAVVYARWKLVSYKITYIGVVDSTNPNPKTYTVEDYITLNSPTKIAHTFIGWTGTGLGKDTVLSLSIPPQDTGARSYTAHWTVNIYKITFVTEDTTMIRETDNKSASAGRVLSMPPNPKAGTGYTFDDWYTEVADSLVKVTTSLVFDDDATVNAVWKPIKYKITYNLNGGAIDTNLTDPNPDTYTIEDAITLSNPTKIAHTFVGWTGTGIDKGDTLLTVSIAQGDTGAKSYTANWSINIYTISFVDDGNTTTQETGKTSASAGKLASLPKPAAKPGYYFEGWFTDEADSVAAVTIDHVFDDDALVYAVWTPIHIVTFNAKGGSVSPATVNTGSGGKIASLPAPTRAGYLFDGWYTGESDEEVYGDKVDTNTVFINDATVYAGWATSYTVKFNAGANGKLTAKVDGDSITTGDTVRVGKSVVFTAIPDSGYIVDGWKVNGTAVSGDIGATYTLSGVSTTAAAVEASFAKKISVASPDRVIPISASDGNAAVAPVNHLTAEFTAGPNPARSPGAVGFFRNGARVSPASRLIVYDASGNVVRTLDVKDNAAGNNGRRAVGSWDLRDANGRPVPNGAYLVKGVLKTPGGKNEKVSVIVGVR